MTPTGTATSTASANAVRPSSTVAGRYPRATRIAGSRKWIERPKSPCATWPRNTAYCTGSGRSVPSSLATRANSLRGASGGSSSGTGSPDSRMTTKTTVETSQREIAARRRREARNGRSPRMVAGTEPGVPSRPVSLRAAELEVETADFELLERIGRPLHILLEAVILVRLDHGDPGQVLQEELGHPLVCARPEFFVDREARGAAELVE